MKKSLFVQLVHNCVYTARFIQIFHISRTCRCKVAQVRGLFTNSICKINLKIHANFMRNCRKMQHTVGRASKCHIYRQRIQDCIFCHDISRTDIFLQQFHYLHTCFFRKADSLRIYCWNGPITTESHTKGLCQAVHTICCIHTGTGTTGRADIIFKFTQSFI